MIVRFFALFKRINSLKFGFFCVIIYTTKDGDEVITKKDGDEVIIHIIKLCWCWVVVVLRKGVKKYGKN